MNRREFLLSLLSVPFGWKELFRKEVKEEEDCSSMSEEEWNSRMDCRSAYLGGGEIGKADGSLFHALRTVKNRIDKGMIPVHEMIDVVYCRPDNIPDAVMRWASIEDRF